MVAFSKAGVPDAFELLSQVSICLAAAGNGNVSEPSGGSMDANTDHDDVSEPGGGSMDDNVNDSTDSGGEKGMKGNGKGKGGKRGSPKGWKKMGKGGQGKGGKHTKKDTDYASEDITHEKGGYSRK
jgi:hypothetical protein